MTGIYIGTSPLKAAYVGTTPVKEIYVGTTKVRPNQQRNLSKSNNSEEIKKSEIETLNVEIEKDKIENTNSTGSVAGLKK